MTSASAYDQLGFVKEKMAQSDFESVEYTRTSSPRDPPAASSQQQQQQEAASSQPPMPNHDDDIDNLSDEAIATYLDNYDAGGVVAGGREIENQSFDVRSAASQSTSGSRSPSPEHSYYNGRVDNFPVIVENTGGDGQDGDGDSNGDNLSYDQDGDDISFPYEDTDGVYGSSYAMNGDDGDGGGVSDLGFVDGGGDYSAAAIGGTSPPRTGPSDASIIAAKTSVYAAAQDLEDVDVDAEIGASSADNAHASPFDSHAADFSSHADIPSTSSSNPAALGVVSSSPPAALGVVSSFDDRPRNTFPSTDAASTSEFVSSLTPAATASSPSLAEEIAAQQIYEAQSDHEESDFHDEEKTSYLPGDSDSPVVITRKKSQLDVLFDADDESDPAVNDLFAPIETSLLEEDDEKPKRRSDKPRRSSPPRQSRSPESKYDSSEFKDIPTTPDPPARRTYQINGSYSSSRQQQHPPQSAGGGGYHYTSLSPKPNRPTGGGGGGSAGGGRDGGYDSDSSVEEINSAEALSHYKRDGEINREYKPPRTGLLAQAGLSHGLASKLRIIAAKNASNELEDFTVYIIEYRDAKYGSRTLSLRFSEMFQFSQLLKRTFSCPPIFPDRSLVKRFDPEFVNQRILDLQLYLAALTCRYDIRQSRLLEQFLEFPAQYRQGKRLRPRFCELMQKINLFKFVVKDLIYIAASNSILAIVADRDPLNRLESWFVELFGSGPNPKDEEQFTPRGVLYGFYGFNAPAMSPSRRGRSSTSPVSANTIGGSAPSSFIQTLSTPLKREPQCIAWDAERRWVFIGMDNGSVEIVSISHDFTYSVNVANCQVFGADPVVSLSYTNLPSEKDASLLVCSREGSVAVYDANLKGLTARDFVSESGWAKCILYDGQSKRAFVGTVAKEILIVDVGTPKLNVMHRMELQDGSVRCFSFDRRMQMLASGSFDQSVAIWHLPSRGQEEDIELVGYLKAHDSPVECVCFSPNGLFLASGDENGHVVVWDLNVDIFNAILSYHPHDKAITAIQMQNDGRVFTSSADQTIQVWKVDLADKQSTQFLNLVPIDANSTPTAAPPTDTKPSSAQRSNVSKPPPPREARGTGLSAYRN